MSYLNWEVGQKVVCFRAFEQRPMPFEVMPTLGGVYTIRNLFVYADGDVVIRLVEIVNKPFPYSDTFAEVCFSASNFRPVKTTDISCFEKLLVNLPVSKELEDAR